MTSSHSIEPVIRRDRGAARRRRGTDDEWRAVSFPDKSRDPAPAENSATAPWAACRRAAARLVRADSLLLALQLPARARRLLAAADFRHAEGGGADRPGALRRCSGWVPRAVPGVSAGRRCRASVPALPPRAGWARSRCPR